MGEYSLLTRSQLYRLRASYPEEPRLRGEPSSMGQSPVC